jgi:hypothetical protein
VELEPGEVAVPVPGLVHPNERHQTPAELLSQRYQATQATQPDPDTTPLPRQPPESISGFRFRNPNGTDVDPRNFGIQHQDAHGGSLVQTGPNTWERVFDQPPVRPALNDEQNRVLDAERARQEAERGRRQAEKEVKELQDFHYAQSIQRQMEAENQNRQLQMLEATLESQTQEMRALVARNVFSPAPSAARSFGPSSVPPSPAPSTRFISSSMYGGRTSLSALPPAIAGPSRQYCLNCQGIGHTKAACPNLKPDHRLVPGRLITCDICGQFGHIASYCPNVIH